MPFNNTIKLADHVLFLDAKIPCMHLISAALTQTTNARKRLIIIIVKPVIGMWRKKGSSIFVLMGANKRNKPAKLKEIKKMHIDDQLSVWLFAVHAGQSLA